LPTHFPKLIAARARSQKRACEPRGSPSFVMRSLGKKEKGEEKKQGTFTKTSRKASSLRWRI